GSAPLLCGGAIPRRAGMTGGAAARWVEGVGRNALVIAWAVCCKSGALPLAFSMMERNLGSPQSPPLSPLAATIPPGVMLRPWVKSSRHNRGYTRFGEGSAACGPRPQVNWTNYHKPSREIQAGPDETLWSCSSCYDQGKGLDSGDHPPRVAAR